VKRAVDGVRRCVGRVANVLGSRQLGLERQCAGSVERDTLSRNCR
jgi:hypothetical protein